MIRTTTILAGLALLAASLPAGTGAQANPLPRSTGMGGNHTSLARGFSAVFWNPAGLGMPDNPGWSFTVLPVMGSSGLSPLGLSDIAAYDGRRIPHDTRVRWLDRIRAQGGEAGVVEADITYLAVSVGRVAVSASSSVRGRMNIGPDVAEVLLFGNAGLTGEPRDFVLDGSHVDVAATTTFAASYGVPLRVRIGALPDQWFAVGATIKYTVGNFLLTGQEQGSQLGADPLEVHVRFPMIHTAGPDDDEDFGVRQHLNNGAGYGLDVAASWRASIFSAGVAIRNLVHTFGWDRASLRYRPGEATWTADTSYAHFEEAPFPEAPAALLSRIDGLHGFAPELAASGAAVVLPFLTVTGEIRHALEDNLATGARSHLGVGGELTILPYLPLRAGLALVSGGYELSGGLGLRVGVAQLAAAAAWRNAGFGSNAVVAAGLTFGVP